MRKLLVTLASIALLFMLVAPVFASTPTSTPVLGYSRGNPVGIGVPLTITVNSVGHAGTEYNVRLTLLEVIRGTEAWQRVKTANMFNDPPEAGYEYILARVRFEYLTGPASDKIFRVSTVWFSVVSDEGKEYEFSFYTSEPDPSITADLYPGASHEGWIGFFVAQDDISPLMTFGRKYDGTGGIWFKLYSDGVQTTAPTSTPSPTPTPTATSTSSGIALAGITGWYTRVWGYDANTQTWKLYDPATPVISDLLVLTRGQGYWINCTQAATLVYGANQYVLAAGWNLIGWLN